MLSGLANICTIFTTVRDLITAPRGRPGYRSERRPPPFIALVMTAIILAGLVIYVIYAYQDIAEAEQEKISKDDMGGILLNEKITPINDERVVEDPIEEVFGLEYNLSYFRKLMYGREEHLDLDVFHYMVFLQQAVNEGITFEKSVWYSQKLPQEYKALRDQVIVLKNEIDTNLDVNNYEVTAKIRLAAETAEQAAELADTPKINLLLAQLYGYLADEAAYHNMNDAAVKYYFLSIGCYKNCLVMSDDAAADKLLCYKIGLTFLYIANLYLSYPCGGRFDYIRESAYYMSIIYINVYLSEDEGDITALYYKSMAHYELYKYCHGRNGLESAKFHAAESVKILIMIVEDPRNEAEAFFLNAKKMLVELDSEKM